MFILLPLDKGFQMRVLYFNFFLNYGHSYHLLKSPKSLSITNSRSSATLSLIHQGFPPLTRCGHSWLFTLPFWEEAMHFWIFLLLLLLILCLWDPFLQFFAVLEVSSNPSTFVKPFLTPLPPSSPPKVAAMSLLLCIHIYKKCFIIYNIWYGTFAYLTTIECAKF